MTKIILDINDLSIDIFTFLLGEDFLLDEELLLNFIPPDFMLLIIKNIQYIMCDCK